MSGNFPLGKRLFSYLLPRLLGGMLLPAVLYFAVNSQGDRVRRGWAIPTWRPISSFAVGILALLGPRVPTGLKLFLTALAIADDLGAVLVIALFSSDRLSIGPMIAAGVFLGLIVLASRLRVKRVAVYAVLVMAVWLAVLASGIHATVAGILLAMVVPVRARIQPKQFFAVARQRLAELDSSDLTGEVTTTLKSKEMEAMEERKLHPGYQRCDAWR